MPGEGRRGERPAGELAGRSPHGQHRTRGHRSRAHTADVILYAWGPDLPACLEEAVAALVGLYAVRVRGADRDTHQFTLSAAPAQTLLLRLLEEVLIALDAEPWVPVAARVTPLAPATESLPAAGPHAKAEPQARSSTPSQPGHPSAGSEQPPLQVTLLSAAPDRIVPAGAVPKAVSRSLLEVRHTPQRVSCRFLVDV